MFMKKSILTLLILSLSFYSYSQHKKLEIVCEVFEGHINYGQMQFFVPDSVKQSHLISIRKKSGLSDLGIINMLCLNGWSLIGTSQKVSNTSTYGTVSTIVYHLKLEFFVTDEEFTVIREKMSNLIIR